MKRSVMAVLAATVYGTVFGGTLTDGAITRIAHHDPAGGKVDCLGSCTCDVTMVEFTLTPTAESAIHCRLLLPPAEKWNGRFWGIGNCGLGHNLGPMNGLMLPRVHEGAAACIADMGTADGRHGREVVRDFGWRAAHLMSVQAKKLIAAYYGRPAKKNYFYGLSSGGGQGLHEAQRFPEDYDGIVCYVPAHYRTRHVTEGRAAYRAGKLKEKGFMAQVLSGPDAVNAYDMDDATFARFIETIRDDVDASSTDLDAFVKRGGKLIVVSALSDRIVPSVTARDYCEALAKRYGGVEKLSPFFRAYFLPGRGHTRATGPDGVVDIPSTAALTDWVERGVAPDAMTGTTLKGGTKRIEPWRGEPAPAAGTGKTELTNAAAAWDAAMGGQAASADTEAIRWIDGRELPVEGRPFDDVDHYYDRFTSNLTAKVNGGVHAMRHYTTGMQFRFATDSRQLRFQWVPYLKYLEMDHMPASGVSGIDVYRWDEGRGKWLYVKTGRIYKVEGGTLEIPWTPGDRCLVNLPLYNGVRSFRLGIDRGATVSPLPPRKSGVTKPVVFYGTSITHGGCASRPGMAFPSIIGRDLDVPIVNLGFSGSGRMEYEMSDQIARIDASCYVLDCLPNMQTVKKDTPDYADVTDRSDPLCVIRARYEPFIRNLRAKRPDVPIVMAEHCSVYCRGKGADDVFIRALYEKLVAEGWKNLVYLPKEGMYADDFEGTVDGAHPNDWGMMHMAAAYGRAVKKALELK